MNEHEHGRYIGEWTAGWTQDIEDRVAIAERLEYHQVASVLPLTDGRMSLTTKCGMIYGASETVADPNHPEIPKCQVCSHNGQIRSPAFR